MNTFSRSCILFASFVLPSIAVAAHTTYVFFDFKSCHSYTTENDPLTGDKNYERWEQKAQTFTNHSDENSWTAWSVFHMNDGERLGICRRTHSTKSGVVELFCHEESHNHFPLAGATYKAIKNKQGNLLWFICASGCKGEVPKMVYDEGYESEETDPSSIALEKAYRKFEKTCPGK